MELFQLQKERVYTTYDRDAAVVRGQWKQSATQKAQRKLHEFLTLMNFYVVLNAVVMGQRVSTHLSVTSEVMGAVDFCLNVSQCPNDCDGHLFLNQNLEIRGGGAVPITARNLPTMNTSYEKMEGECVCS